VHSIGPNIRKFSS